MQRREKENLVAQYSLNGFPLTELYGKIPLKDGWRELTAADNACINVDYNLGALLTEEDLVVDVDPRNFEKGDNPLKRLIKEVGAFDTYMVKTGGGGIHIYLKKPKDFPVRAKLKGFKGIDFRYLGGYVVIPGSVHPDTRRLYEISHKTVSEISDAPSVLLELLKKEARPGGDADPSKFTFDDSDRNSDRYLRYIKSAAPLATEGDSGDATTYFVASQGKDFGLSPQRTFEIMWSHWNHRCSPPWGHEDLAGKIDNAFKYTKNEQQHYAGTGMGSVAGDGQSKKVYAFRKDGTLKPIITNVVNFIDGDDKQLSNLFRFNTFTKQIEFKRKPFWHSTTEKATTLRDADVVEIKYYLMENHENFELQNQVVCDAILIVARKEMYHPVMEYLKPLRWDGVPRIENWLIDHAGVVANAYTRAVSKKMLVAAVARIVHPGIKFDCIPVIEGDQGKRKSTLCGILGGEWYADVTLDLKSKDTVEALQGKWFVEVSEMEVTKKADAQSLKAFLSRRIDRIRLPYARNSEDFPRQSIFIGTINPTGNGYLKDSTGNRRFWVIETKGIIDTESIAKVRDQLFAEALKEYRNGCTVFLDDYEALRIAKRESAARAIADAWTDPVINYVTGKVDDEEGVSIMDVAQNALNIYPRDVTYTVNNRIAVILKQAGFGQGRNSLGQLVYKREKGE